MKCCFAGLTDVGLVRMVNQDDYFADPQGRFFIVADGMGGHAGGQEASHIAIEQIQTYLEKHWESDLSSKLLLEGALLIANQSIVEDQTNHPERADMGTTAVVAIFRQGQPWCAHVGDSRLYRLREGDMEQITEDDTWVARALKAGEITTKQARVHPWRHILYKCLGREDLKVINTKPLDLQTGDRLLLCSDGLTEEVSEQMIQNCLQLSTTCEQTVLELVKKAKQSGGSDNITAIVIAIEQV